MPATTGIKIANLFKWLAIVTGVWLIGVHLYVSLILEPTKSRIAIDGILIPTSLLATIAVVYHSFPRLTMGKIGAAVSYVHFGLTCSGSIIILIFLTWVISDPTRKHTLDELGVLEIGGLSVMVGQVAGLGNLIYAACR